MIEIITAVTYQGKITKARIQDVNGYWWVYDYYADKQLDIEWGLFPKDVEDSGYWCDSFEEAVLLLDEMGYLTSAVLV